MSMHTSLFGSAAAVSVGAALLLSAACRGPLDGDYLPPPSFEAVPAAVAPGDTLDLVFTLRNPTPASVRITSSYGCLFFLEAFRGSEPVSIEGSAYGCTTAISTFEIPARDSLQIVVQLIAVSGTSRARFVAGDPLPPGSYRVRTMMNAPLPAVEAVFEVSD